MYNKFVAETLPGTEDLLLRASASYFLFPITFFLAFPHNDLTLFWSQQKQNALTHLIFSSENLAKNVWLIFTV